MDDMHIEKTYDQKLIVLELQHAVASSVGVGSFTIDLTNGGYGELKDVVAIKLYSFEIVPKDGISSPVAVEPASVYIQINDYAHIITGASSVPAAFARATVLANGVSYVGIQPPAMILDPFTYIVDPVIGRLGKFKVSLLKSDGSHYNVNGNNVIITLSVYSRRNKYMMD